MILSLIKLLCTARAKQSRFSADQTLKRKRKIVDHLHRLSVFYTITCKIFITL